MEPIVWFPSSPPLALLLPFFVSYNIIYTLCLRSLDPSKEPYLLPNIATNLLKSFQKSFFFKWSGLYHSNHPPLSGWTFFEASLTDFLDRQYICIYSLLFLPSFFQFQLLFFFLFPFFSFFFPQSLPILHVVASNNLERKSKDCLINLVIKSLNNPHRHGLGSDVGRVVDPVGDYPDPDPTFKKNRIQPNFDLIKFIRNF